MVLDASALVSVILGEASSETVLARLGEARVVAVGAPALVEAAIVLSARLGRDARPMLNELLRELEAEVIPFSREHYEAAVDAFRRYGKGRHAAALNFGDCLAYAVASVAGCRWCSRATTSRRRTRLRGGRSEPRPPAGLLRQPARTRP